MSDNLPKDEDFKLLDFDSVPIPEKVIEKIDNNNEIITHKIDGQDIQIKQVQSINELSPEMQKTAKKLFKSVLKDELKQLTEEIETKKDIMFDKNNEKSAFGKLSDKDQEIFKEKMAEWDVPQELSQLNASVILSWANNTIKEKDK